jgi:hypothetical protein
MVGEKSQLYFSTNLPELLEEVEAALGQHMSVPARRLRQTLFVDGGRRCRSLRQSQPGKEQGQPYNQCSRTNYLFAISILLLDFTLPFAQALKLGSRRNVVA